MQKKEFFIGIDVSKLTLDVSVNGTKNHIRVQNSAEGFKQLVAWLKSLSIELSNRGLYLNTQVAMSTGWFSSCNQKAFVLPVYLVCRLKNQWACKEARAIRWIHCA